MKRIIPLLMDKKRLLEFYSIIEGELTQFELKKWKLV